MTIRPTLGVILLATLLLASCGGSGGGGSAATPARPAFRVLDLTTRTLGPEVAAVDLAAAENRSTRIVFRRIPAGSFLRGQTPGTLGRDSDETATFANVPQTWIAVFELTRAQWEALAGSGDRPWLRLRPSGVVGGASGANDLPATGLSAERIASVLAAFNALSASDLSLPTESVWEYACRGGTSGLFAWGDSLDAATANASAVTALSGASGPRAVGGRAANGFGLYDMHGNAREWAESGSGAVLRGGGWADHPLRCRSANRFTSVDVAQRHALSGVRLVVTP